MGEKQKYYIVAADALPEVFHKVVLAKHLLETGAHTTTNGAVQAAGISRSAFYKYKDAVRPLQDMLHGRIITFQLMMHDKPGALSKVLNIFACSALNVLTINQNIPAGGCALVTITAETSAMAVEIEQFLASIQATDSVIRCEILAG